MQALPLRSNFKPISLTQLPNAAQIRNFFTISAVTVAKSIDFLTVAAEVLEGRN